MAVAFIQEFAIDPGGDRSTTNYDAVNEKLTTDQEAPDGLLIHYAGFDEDAGVFRVVNVWQSRQQGQAYLDERVMPAVREVLGADMGGGAPPTREGWYELHHVAGV
jgi:quinol monooxygenase YgiN